MTLSQTENGIPTQKIAAPQWPTMMDSCIDFAIGPEASPVEAMERAGAMTSLSLPRLLEETPGATDTLSAVQAVLTELVDVTARHKAGLDLVVRLAFDGAHVTVSVGDMDCPLPAAAEEPGLYLVYGVASEVGQHVGDNGGRVTWAAVPA